MSAIRRETTALGRLAVPIVLANLGTMAMGMVDLMMIGRLNDAQAMAGAAVANTWVHGTLMFAMGVVFGIDPIVTHSHGAGDVRRSALALQRGLVIAGLVSVLVMLLWTFSGEFLSLAGQDEGTVAVGATYTRSQIFSVAPFLLFIALRQYLQGRGVLAPILAVVVVANLANVLFNWALIFGNLGCPALGVRGAGIATGATRVVMLLGLVAVVRFGNLTEGAWVPWSRAAAKLSGLREVLRYGLPTALQMSLEVWAFGCATLMAGTLGDEAVSAHSVVLSLAAMAFMVPMGISAAACTRIGNLLGEGRPERARAASLVAFVMGAGVMSLSAVVLLATGTAIPALFFGDVAEGSLPEVIALAASIIPIAAAFQIFDGIQVVGCGILRGQGQTLPAAAINLIGYWVLALPIGWWMTFRLDMGLRGVWWGLALALSLVAVALVLYVRARGPGCATGAPASLDAKSA
ncbi:MAG: MATE family efflux transporter [Planctomycetota bacterium]|nr:MATE family efflux transporter [Planctomycetota bacterium]